MKKFYEDDVYIKMCKKASDIQAGHQITKFDLFQDSNSGNIFSYDDNILRKYIGTWIWLPRQDQLMRIIDFEGTILIQTSDRWGIGVLAGGEIFYDIINCASPEIALLQYYMLQRFHKVWDGENWI